MLDFNEYSKIIKECKALSNRKNAIYGVNNLKLFNGLSILVRINDKIARLNNLCHQTILKSDTETIEDTIKDLINYSIYYLMLKRNKLEKS